MSRLDDLIQELCPNGVEKRSISEISTITRGRVMSKDYIQENIGNYPVYSSQTENNGELGKISTYDFDGEYLTWTTDGANAGSVFYRNGKFSVTNVCGLIKVIDNNILTKYIYYALSCTAKNYVNSGMGNPKLMSNVMAKIKIFVPPIEVQREIVRILDNFTELTAELETEFKFRNRQYEYYRDELLEFKNCYTNRLNDMIQKFCPNGVEYVKLSEIAYSQRKKNNNHITENAYSITKNGLVPTSKYFGDKTQITSSDTSGYYIVETNWFVCSPSRIDVGSINYLHDDGPVIVSPLDVVFSVDSKKIYPEYLLNILKSHKGMFQILQHRQGIEGTGRKTLPFKEFSKITIPLPPLEIQREIMIILNSFNALLQNLTSEIEAQQKQYEYYRDKLLTFKELN
ncbi:MAG: restriction endonuclease subunit S [Erysipelotrichaceae bacterium]|nr:restriction endonuclease subunit S [Erysipelotrichaceae bacterium]